MNKKIIYTLLIGTLTFGSLTPTLAATGFASSLKEMKRKAKERLEVIISKMRTIESQNAKIIGLNTIIVTQNHEINSQNDKIKGLNASIANQSGQIKLLSGKNKLLSDQNNDMDSTIGKKDSEINAQNNIIARLTNEADLQCDKIKQMDATIRQLTEKSDLEKIFAQLAKQCEEAGEDSAIDILASCPIFDRYITNTYPEAIKVQEDYNTCKDLIKIAKEHFQTIANAEAQAKTEMELENCFNNTKKVLLKQKAQECLSKLSN